MKKIKAALFKECILFVSKREETVTSIISSNQKALTSETKSSAGDKHETGRAMLQLEMEKASQQLEGIYNMKTTLAKIKHNNVSSIAKLGSLIITDKAAYFMAISVGEVTFENKKYYLISPSSPIGKLLLGKSKNDTFRFNNKESIILEIY